MRHLKTKNFIKFPVKPNSIHSFNVMPILQRDDEIEAFLDSNTANTENRGYIDDTDAADLDVITREFRRGRHELAPLQHGDPRHVVGHETVATLN